MLKTDLDLRPEKLTNHNAHIRIKRYTKYSLELIRKSKDTKLAKSDIYSYLQGT